MTIIVGILCNDGVIIASDGMASNNLGTTPFVGLENLKTNIINDNLIVACAGSDEVMGLFLNYLHLNVTDFFKNTDGYINADYFASAIHSGFINYCVKLIDPYPDSLKADNPLKNNLINQFQAIIAFKFRDNHYMYSINGINTPTMARNNGGIWHYIMGSGLLTGQPSIHLIKKILNIKSMPNVSEAINLAYWTISHVIEVSSGGVGGNITIAKLGKDQSGSYCISNADTTGIDEYISDMYKHIVGFHNKPLTMINNNENIEIAPSFKASTN